MHMIRIAAFGDIHGSFDDEDLRMIQHSDYDMVLIVGDLPGRTHAGTLDVARRLARMPRPAYFMPGNHDGVSLIQLIAELQGNHSLVERSHRRQFKLVENLKAALAPVSYCAYSLHEINIKGMAISLVAARPHSMGGTSFSYRPYLEKEFGISDMNQSAEKIKRLLDEARSPVLILAHNGPAGLGSKRDDIFGCDFRKEEGDFGDPDLADALDYAEGANIPVLGVVAGHMHHRIRGGGERVTIAKRKNTLCVNCARVPRIFKEEGQTLRHHVRIEISEKGMEVEQVTRP